MRLRFTRPALVDLDELLEYVHSRSPKGAERVGQRIRSLIDQLPQHPFIGKQTEDPSIRRLMTFPFPYLIFYEVNDTEIVVHAVRHGARDDDRTLT